MATEDDGVDRLRLLVADHFSVGIDRVVDQAKFVEDLGGDSLDRVELAFLVEDTFGVDIDSLTHQPSTVGELIEAVRAAKA